MHHFSGHGGHRASELVGDGIPGMPLFDLESTGVELDCVSGDGWDFDSPPRFPDSEDRLLATTSFEVPVDAAQLTFLSRGQYSYGHVDFVVADSVGDNVKVDVEARYYTRHALDRARACRFKSEQHGEGVAILTPRHGHHRDHRDLIRFNLTVHIPPQAEALRRITSLQSSFPLYSQTMHDLTEAIDFGKAGLYSSNQPILVKDIHVRDVVVLTSNAPIRGSFNTSSDLKLSTSNAPIQVDVAAYNEDAVSNLFIHTSNSLLSANLSLFNSPASNGAGAFNVTAATSNSRLQVNHLTSPPSSVLNGYYVTSNSPAFVRLDPAYEGSFAATSSLFAPHIELIENAEDPAGRNRERKVHVNFVVRGAVRGTVGWEPLEHEPGQPGSVTVVSSNSPVYLTL